MNDRTETPDSSDNRPQFLAPCIAGPWAGCTEGQGFIHNVDNPWEAKAPYLPTIPTG